MRKRFLCGMLVLSLLVLFSACGSEPEPISAERGEPIFGSFAASDLNGNIVSEKIFEGHALTMVNIWATYCGPCIQEMPGLARIDDEMGKDVQVLGIVIDAVDRNGTLIPAKQQQALSVVQTTGADYAHLLPSKAMNSAFLDEVQFVPTTVFVDENGCQIGTSYAGAKSEQEWREIIKALLESVEE